MVRLVMLVMSIIPAMGRGVLWVCRDRKRFAVAVLAVALLVTYSGYTAKAGQGDGIPEGFKLQSWDDGWSGMPCINLATEDNGYGSYCGIVLCNYWGELSQSYSCAWDKELFKAGALLNDLNVVGTLTVDEAAIWESIVPNWAGWAALTANSAPPCPYGVCAQVDPGNSNKVAFSVVTGPVFGQAYVATESNPGPYTFAQLKGLNIQCHASCGVDFLSSAAVSHWSSIAADYTLANTCCGGGGGQNCSPGNCLFTWTGNAWSYWQGTCTGSCSCCPPTTAGTYLGETGSGTCRPNGIPCPGIDPPPPPPPCANNGGDSDGDGCCDDVDCYTNDATRCTCQPGPCENAGGDGDGDGCCAQDDQDDSDPDVCDEPCFTAGDSDGDGCCSDVDYDDSDPEICNQDDETGCGRCKWRLKQTNEDGEGVDPIYEWEKARGCKDDDCDCKEPVDDPNDEEIQRVQYTKCKAKCECSEDYLARRQAIYDRFKVWFPDPSTVQQASTGQMLKWEFDFEWFRTSAPIANGPNINAPVHFMISFNPEDWGPFANKIAPALDFCRNLLLVLLMWWFAQFTFHTLLGV